MVRRFISFGSTPMYFNAATNLTKEAITMGGFDSSHVYTKSALDNWFVEHNKIILSNPVGDGFWLWKPYCIFKDLYNLKDGDILVYCDSLYEFMPSTQKMAEFFEEQLSGDNDIFLVSNKPNDGTYPETQFTKGDPFVLIPGDNKLGPQVWAGFVAVRKSFRSMNFISQWLTYAQDPRIISDDMDVINKPYADFYRNRRDQSALSLVAKNNNIQFHKCPSMLNDLRNPYPKLALKSYNIL